jgi:hypothetical protein
MVQQPLPEPSDPTDILINMTRKNIGLLLILISLLTIFLFSGCQQSETPQITPSVTVSFTPTFTRTATTTLTPTVTQTSTLANTITPRPSNTPTITPSPYPSLTPTLSPTVAPLQPAVLFPYKDLNGKVVDWSYIHVTEIGFDESDQVDNLWAFIGFQLLDRGIHRRNFTFKGEPITVYYLNVAHEFKGVSFPMQLVLGGTKGANIPIDDIPAGGDAYIQMQVRDSSEDFEPYVTHRDANRDFEYRTNAYPLWLIKDLQALLPTLPDEIILLADHPILFPPGDWYQIGLDMGRVSYLAARYQPFFKFDPYDRIIDQSDFVYDLTNFILKRTDMPEGFYAFSSQTLIIIKNE